jgi:hypothetical protein
MRRLDWTIKDGAGKRWVESGVESWALERLRGRQSTG